MIKWGTISMVLVVVLVSSCSSTKNGENSDREDLTAKELLQGVWLDDETDMPLMRISGDTIYYADPQNAPVYFKVLRDTIYLRGNTLTAYKIDRQTEYSFWFHSLSDDIVKLYKSDNPEDTLAFSTQEVEVIPSTSEVIKKDSVVMYHVVIVYIVHTYTFIRIYCFYYFHLRRVDIDIAPITRSFIHNHTIFFDYF